MRSEAPVEGADASTINSNAVSSARWLTVVLLLAMATALRFTHLLSKPFWFDECFSTELARINWRTFLHLLWWREANMMLYYLLLRAWLHFGQSEFLIRGLSALISVATLPAIYWVARLFYDRRVAVMAAALFTFNAYSVRYAQEARGYALFLLLGTLSSGLLISRIRRPVKRNRAAYVMTSILAVYAHLYALLLIAAHWITLRCLGRPDLGPNQNNAEFSAQMRRSWKILTVAVAPLLVFVAKTGAGPIRWIPRPGLHDVLEFFEHLAGSESWPLLAVYALACLGAIAPLGLKVLQRDDTWENWRVQFLLIWLLFPVVLTFLLSFARPVFLARYMIFCLPPLVILAAAGLARLRQPWMLAAALTLMMFLSLRGVFFIYGHDFDSERDASGAASNFILDQSQPGDGVLFHIAQGRVPYEFFRSVRAGVNTASPSFTSQLGPEILFPYHGPGLTYRDFTGNPTPEFLRSLAPNHHRLWVFLIDNGPPENPDPTTRMLTTTMPALFPHMREWQFPKVDVRLYSQ
ncbi:MAG TPA: hypothetical protein VMR80_05600 [Candidatus Acidoferrum sp.]|nr:hypothetical protein [Candidatus Acidoferrum sp.]